MAQSNKKEALFHLANAINLLNEQEKMKTGTRNMTIVDSIVQAKQALNRKRAK